MADMRYAEEIRKMRKERRGKVFYTMATLSYGALLAGVITPIIMGNTPFEDVPVRIYVCGGIYFVAALLLMIIGNWFHRQ